ncbi:MAG: cupin domain protein [Halonotius sp. J07HN4]|nr:MAG: cupin domain protein [Halonotius sp. J07HN4]
MNQCNVSTVAAQLSEEEEGENEVLRKDSFSLQVMRFETGDEDPMHAHAEDEIYHIDAGSATLVTEDESVEVDPGDVVHLGPGTEHQFTDFDDEFVVTVMYAPAEGTQES